MKPPIKFMSAVFATVITLTSFPDCGMAANTDTVPATMFSSNSFVEKEQPEINTATKQLIVQYQKNPTEENYQKLKDMVIENYNAVIKKKEDKLAELKEETSGKPGGDEKVAEMEEIVQEMYTSYWDRINETMLRFTDSRLLKWSIADASNYSYIPVMGAGETVYIKRTPVTNAEYYDFITATGYAAPSNWSNGCYPAGEDSYPVNNVSYEDAEAYCAWLTANDESSTYRMPTEMEWELAAGHMPKDADFNCGVTDGRTPVEQYAGTTRGAHGAVDFWGNVWEWTSTISSDTDGITMREVKGGSWSSSRTDCRTENRAESRDSSSSYEDVGFRVIQIQSSNETSSSTKEKPSKKENKKKNPSSKQSKKSKTSGKKKTAKQTARQTARSASSKKR